MGMIKKRKMGRPPRGAIAAAPRTLRTTAEEWELWARAARAQDETRTAYMVRIMNRDAKRVLGGK